MSADVLQALRAVANGLLYTSETDAPLELVRWPRGESILTASDILALIGKDQDAPISEIGLEAFFRDLIQDQDWHDEDAKRAVQQYRNLLVVLKQTLKNLKVFKIGEVQIDIYIVGRAPDGEWAGIKTTAVET
jgi:hypothetical protein